MGFSTDKVLGAAQPTHTSASTSLAYAAPASYSDEQLAIIKSSADVVVGQAFAGTGKSTTGIGYALHHPDKRILVICFNRANAQESKEKYAALNHPSIDVCTTHALAWMHLSRAQKQRIANRWNAITLRHDLPMVGANDDMRTAAIVASLLSEFFMTEDTDLDPALHGDDARNRLNASDAVISKNLIYAQRLWAAMTSEAPVKGMRASTNTVAIPHDAYLKMSILNAGNLGYDTVIFDEAQDANPIMLKFLKTQHETGAKIIMLGDRHQSIYGFRGALNALEDKFLLPGAHVLPLTQSWRFGAKTAEIANLLLGELKGERFKIKGMGTDVAYRAGKPMTYLSRTNADLFREAAAINGKGVQWVGGIESYRVSILDDVWSLYCNRMKNIQDPFIKRNFHSWGEFERAAQVDQESKILADMVETYGDAIPSLVKTLITNAKKTQVSGNIRLTLSTGHKAKGLEWDNVRISNDFSGTLKSAENWLAGKTPVFPEQEVNLLYVATTRARHHLFGNQEMEQWLSRENLKAQRGNRIRRFSDPQAQLTFDAKELAPIRGVFSDVKRPVFR